MRRRDAPSDRRIPISLWRETPRASSRLATFAQPIIRINPKAKKIGEKNSSAVSRIGRQSPLARSQHHDVGFRRDRCQIPSTRRPRGESRRRRLDREPRLQSPDDLDGGLVLCPRIGIAELSREREWCPVIRREDAEAAKAVGHHANDLVRRGVDEHAAADHHRITCEQLLPAHVTEHNHGSPGKPLVIPWHQRASERRPHSQGLEEVSRHERASHETALDARSNGAQHGDGIREDACLAAHRLIFSPRERQPIRADRASTAPRQRARTRSAPHRCAGRKRYRA